MIHTFVCPDCDCEVGEAWGIYDKVADEMLCDDCYFLRQEKYKEEYLDD